MRLFPLLAAVAVVAAPAAAAGLTVGAKAPTFATRGAIAGKVVNIDLAQQLKKGPVVLYFFPAAFTSGCNAEAHAFAEAVDDFGKAGATVIGMTAGNVDQLAAFSSEKCAGKFAVAAANHRRIELSFLEHCCLPSLDSSYRLPRRSCSRSIAWNSALKLPLPKPLDPCRSMSSKNTVGRS